MKKHREMMKLSADNVLKWSQNYSNWLPAIQWGGWIVVTLISANLFWVITLYIVSPDVSKQKSDFRSKASVTHNSGGININQLVGKQLFGHTNAQAVAVAENVVEVETRLNLILRGVYAANNSKRSNSIIEDSKGKQEVYFIDDPLKVSGRVFLRQVYPDRVILETNGVKEVLRLKNSLPADMKSKKVAGKGKKSDNRVDDKRKNRQISNSLNKYRKQLQDDPLSLVGLINYQPKMVNGEMIGIQISPGKDKRLFTQLGLRRRDVITSINGVSLSNPQNALQLMAEIQDMQELEVSINRGNESVNLLLNLNPDAKPGI